MRIYIKESRYTEVEVDAYDYNEARAKVEDAYQSGKLELTDENSSVVVDIDITPDLMDEVLYYPATEQEFAGKI